MADFQFGTGPAIMGTIAARGDSHSIGCRIVVDGAAKAETISHEVNVVTFCLLKAA
ncbi:MAG TPA: MmpS family transport accessory protein [Steroidobacteraceae bacterium]|nr:MmpS family transport accessory protein [Steroidobacteraceae bacterium]HXA90704.1 MmpS family transport accessory protein [Mycobacterium sp.]